MIKKHAKAATLAALVGISTVATAGCGSAGARVVPPPQNLPEAEEASLEDVMKSVYCVKVVAEYAIMRPEGSVSPLDSKVVGRVTQMGTAFAFSSDNKYMYLVTANHIVETEEMRVHPLLGLTYLKSVSMKLVDNKLDENEKDDVPVELIPSNAADMDIALLRTTSPLYVSHAYKIADQKSLKVGERVFIAGYPLSVTKALSAGTIANTTGVPHDTNPEVACMVLADADIASGNSGGPMFVSHSDGLRFAGIVTHRLAFMTAAVGTACFDGRIPALSYSSKPANPLKQ